MSKDGLEPLCTHEAPCNGLQELVALAEHPELAVGGTSPDTG